MFADCMILMEVKYKMKLLYALPDVDRAHVQSAVTDLKLMERRIRLQFVMEQFLYHFGYESFLRLEESERTIFS